MPPRKEKCSPEFLRELMANFDIQFQGPILPEHWPEAHKETFAPIRTISRLCYDEYKQDENRDILTVIEMKERVKELRKRAHHLRKVRALEDFWKDSLLPVVLARFNSEVVCKSCRNEIWKSEFQVFPAGENEALKLRRKRERRKLCQCDPRLQPSEDNDDDGGLSILDYRCGDEVHHDPHDQLEHLSIPMRPDRVVGLLPTYSLKRSIALCPQSIRHCPLKDGKLLYPFLVIEAKSEKDGPGFESIEAQTAFPIRRLLKLQEDLRTSRGVKIDPLVWFFAFQGDEWRLYAATLQQTTVNVIDIWHGNVISHNGALQLLLIVDVICDWARDMYCPDIRKCLAGDMPQFSRSTISPSSRSQSVMTHETGRAFSMPQQHGLEMEFENQLPRDENAFRFLSSSEVSSHPFSRWTTDHYQLNIGTNDATIRHSSLVNCSFRVLEIPTDPTALAHLQFSLSPDDYDSRPVSHLLERIQNTRYTTWLTRRDICLLESRWTGRAIGLTPGPNAKNPDECIGAFIFFRTFCTQEDWQLTREICCIIWSLESATLADTIAHNELILFDHEIWPSFKRADVFETLLPLQTLCGRSSVAYALSNATFILWNESGLQSNSQLKWELPPTDGIEEAIIARCVDCMNVAAAEKVEAFSTHCQSSRYLEVLRSQMPTEVSPSLPQIPDDISQSGAMLAIKPDSWPENCPRFCLFVLVEGCFDQQGRFGQLLSDVTQERVMYGVSGLGAAGLAPILSRDDRLLIRRWIGWLGGDSRHDLKAMPK